MLKFGGIRVARIGGIAVDVHLTFGLVILWGAWQGWARYGSSSGAGFGILAILLLFASVLLHELGHGLQARALGLIVRRITLFPIGGLAELETIPSHPWQELLVGLAGPIVNLGLAVVIGGIAYLVQPFTWYGWGDYLLFRSPPVPLTMLLYVFWVNVVLFFFNMLPAFPMDGGRVIRSALAILTNYEAATHFATWLGRILALAMAVSGAVGWFVPRFTPNPLLIVVALVVYSGAHQEDVYVRRRRALLRVVAGEVCRRPDYQIAPWDSISQPLIDELTEHNRVLPVVVDSRLMGLLTVDDVGQVVGLSPPETVAHLMRVDFPIVHPQDTLWVALREMTEAQLPALPVVDDGRYCGVISLDDIKHAWRFVARRRNGMTLPLSGDTTE